MLWWNRHAERLCHGNVTTYKMVWKKRAKNSTFSIHGNDAIIIDKIEMNFTKMWRDKFIMQFINTLSKLTKFYKLQYLQKMLLRMVSVDFIFCYYSVKYQANFIHHFTVVRDDWHKNQSNHFHMFTTLSSYLVKFVRFDIGLLFLIFPW